MFSFIILHIAFGLLFPHAFMHSCKLDFTDRVSRVVGEVQVLRGVIIEETQITVDSFCLCGPRFYFKL